jgi:hypothetical protein
MPIRVERDANNIDLDLYRLICRVEQMHVEATPTDRKEWALALDRLRCARPHIRRFMSKEDRAAT